MRVLEHMIWIEPAGIEAGGRIPEHAAPLIGGKRVVVLIAVLGEPSDTPARTHSIALECTSEPRLARRDDRLLDLCGGMRQ